MGFRFHAVLPALAAVALFAACQPGGPAKEENPAEVIRYDREGSLILRGVEVPPGKAVFYTSGTVAPVADTSAAPGDPKRFGDTYTQSMGTLRRIEELLNEAGLGMKDVIMLRVYLVPDPRTGNRMDFAGWNEAYKAYFGNEKNPNKVARTTISVPHLANPDLLVEIEAVAVRP